MSTVLEITCTKPECHWKGPPGEAPSHPCPTPDPDAHADIVTNGDTPAVESPFVGLPDAHGLPIADTDVDEDQRYHVVWSHDENTILVGTTDNEDDAIGIATMTDAGKGVVEVIDRGPARESLAAAKAQEEPPAAAIPFEAEPTTQDELEAWLLAHGQYDDAGIPLDEKTATLDAQLSAFSENDDELPAIPEPDLDDTPAAIAADATVEEVVEAVAQNDPAAVDAAVEALHGELETGVGVDAPIQGPRPWETVIAAALAEQTGIKEYRWLVIWKPEDETREAELIGRARVKNEAVVIQEQVQHDGKLDGAIEVVKTSEVLAAAEALEVERKRKLVEEPDRVIEPEPTPEPKPEEPKPDEEPEPTVAEAAAAAQAAQPPPPVGKSAPLFNASDYEREDLALPKVDGHSIDRIAVDISGSVMLDRSNPDHVALWRRMKLGTEVELWVTAKGLGFAGKGATNKEGDLDVVVGRRSIAVNMLRIIPAEGMQAAADELAAQARDAHETGEDGLSDG